MDHTTLHMGQKDEVRRIIIGAPLLLVAVFCFGFFMIHPAGSGEVHSSSSSSAAASHKKTPATSTSSLNELTPLPMAKTTLSTLPQASPADGSTASPQSANGSSTVNAGAKAGTFTGHVGSGQSHDDDGGVLQTVLNGGPLRNFR